MKPEGNISEFDLWVRNTIEQGSTAPPPGAWESIQSSVPSATSGASGALDAIRQFIVKQAAWKTAALVLGGVSLTAVLILVPKSDVPLNKNTKQHSAISESTATQNKEELNTAEEILQVKDSGNESFSGSEPNQSGLATKPILEPGLTAQNTSTQPELGQLRPPDQTHTNTSIQNAVNTPELHVIALGGCSTKAFELSTQGQYADWWVNGTLKAQGVSKIGLNIDKTTEVTALLRDGSKLSTTLNYTHNTPDFNATLLSDGWVKLSAMAPEASLIIWHTGHDADPVYNQSEVKFRVHAAHSYPEVSMIVRNVNGCTDTVTKTIESEGVAFKEPIIPNIFTPYVQDGFNDEFKIDMETPEQFQLIIRNIKGETVFETRNHEEGWNGRRYNQGELCPKGKYIFSLVYRMYSGDTETRQNSLLLN